MKLCAKSLAIILTSNGLLVFGLVGLVGLSVSIVVGQIPINWPSSFFVLKLKYREYTFSCLAWGDREMGWITGSIISVLSVVIWREKEREEISESCVHASKNLSRPSPLSNRWLDSGATICICSRISHCPLFDRIGSDWFKSEISMLAGVQRMQIARPFPCKKELDVVVPAVCVHPISSLSLSIQNTSGWTRIRIH